MTGAAIIDTRTSNRGYPVPVPSNLIRDDQPRVAAAITAIDTDMAVALAKIGVPAGGTTGQVPVKQSSSNGDIAWQSLPGTTLYRRQKFTATAGQTVFTVSGGYDPGTAAVILNGIPLDWGLDYGDSNGATIVLTEAAAAGDIVLVQAYAGAQLVATTADLVSYSSGVAGTGLRTVQERLKDFWSVKDLGAKGDGLTNDAGAFTAANAAGEIIVPKGTYLIGSNITITAALTFAPGAKLVRGSGVTITINGRVNADLYQLIFDATVEGAFIGTFGGRAISIGWFGAVSDAVISVGGAITGTNNLAAIRRAVAARHATNEAAARVMVPDGRWYITGNASPAITGGGLNIGAGLIQLQTGDAFVGSGWDTCRIYVGGASAGVGGSGIGNAIVIGNTDTQGPPSMVGGFMLAGAQGGAYSCHGVVALANGVMLYDLWTSGFNIGIRMASTDQFLRNFVCEYSGAAPGMCGLRVERGNTNISDGTLFLCSDGVVIDHVDNQGTTVIQNVRINTAINIYGRFGMAINGTQTKVAASNITVEGQHWTIAFRVTSPDNVQLTNCSARVWNNCIGFSMDGGSNTHFNNCTAEIVGGTAVDNAGFRISSGAGSVSIMGGYAKGFSYGVYCDTAAGPVRVIGAEFELNITGGIVVPRCASFIASGCFVAYNGTGASNSNYGIYVRQDNPYERASINGCNVTNQANSNQEYGIYLVCNNALSKINVTGGSVFGSFITDYTATGSSSSNIISTGLQVG